MNLEIVSAHELSLREQADIFNAAFAGYLVTFPKMDEATFARFVCIQGADLCHSRFVRADKNLTGFGYINRTGNVARLCGMGVVPEARRTGAASFLLEKLFEEARTRRENTMTLEVFEQNEPAVALYRRHGFEEVTRLFGWRGSSRDSHPPAALEEISVLEATQLGEPFRYPKIPWQISQYAVLKASGTSAFRSGDHSIVLGDVSASPLRVYGFFGKPGEEIDWTSARNVLANAMNRFADKEFFAPQVFPEEFGTKIFGPLGFKREPLNQFMMKRELQP